MATLNRGMPLGGTLAGQRGFFPLRDWRALQGSWNRGLHPERKGFIRISAQLYQRVVPLPAANTFYTFSLLYFSFSFLYSTSHQCTVFCVGLFV